MNIPDEIVNKIIMMARPSYKYVKELQNLIDINYDDDDEFLYEEVLCDIYNNKKKDKKIVLSNFRNVLYCLRCRGEVEHLLLRDGCKF